MHLILRKSLSVGNMLIENKNVDVAHIVKHNLFENIVELTFTLWKTSNIYSAFTFCTQFQQLFNMIYPTLTCYFKEISNDETRGYTILIDNVDYGIKVIEINRDVFVSCEHDDSYHFI